MANAPKVVFDTNIFVSAIIFGGNPRACLEMVRNGEIRLFTSRTLLFELSESLQRKFGYSGEEVEEIILGIAAFTDIVEPGETVGLIKTDKSDNRVLEVAAEVGADFIVSGDKKHILSLGKFRKTKILNASEFVKRN